MLAEANGDWLAQQRGGFGKDKAILSKLVDETLKRARSVAGSLKPRRIGKLYRHLQLLSKVLLNF